MASGTLSLASTGFLEARTLSSSISGPREVANLPLGPHLLVFSGGTAFNSVAGQLRRLTTNVTHVLPVSDDGGSTAEIVRVLGGPAVGDIRSRCLRLADDSDDEARAVKQLLAHRLSSSNAAEAKMEWYSIVEGEHALWNGVSEPYKHMIRAFLLHFQTQILSHPHARFDFTNGSIGNFFFAGARVFFRSLEAAIFLFSRVARLPQGSLVLPAISTEECFTLGAELEDGTIMCGQNAISHPTNSGSSPCTVDKGQNQALPSPIRRIFYLSKEGDCKEHEVSPPANPRMLSEIERSDAIVFAMGSIYTSICPSLCLEGVGEAISERDVPKVMLLNGCHDRETSCSGIHEGPMTAADMVQAVTDSLNRRRNRRGPRLRHPPRKYVNHLLYPAGTTIEVDTGALRLMGVERVVEVASYQDRNGDALFHPQALVQAVGEVVAAAAAADTAAAEDGAEAAGQLLPIVSEHASTSTALPTESNSNTPHS